MIRVTGQVHRPAEESDAYDRFLILRRGMTAHSESGHGSEGTVRDGI